MSDILRLKKSNCKNCYKCIRHCPVKSIRFSANQAHIVSDECILCGQCFVVCPQDAKEIRDDTERARTLLQSGVKVIASLAPSFAANYHTGIGAMEQALKKLGFFAAEETAVGAAYVKTEYERLVREHKTDVLISSCCSTVNLMIRKYFPAALSSLAPVMTPMHAHYEDIKRRYPDAKVIFIGPCISKKAEAEEEGKPDCVLTFEELTRWLESQNIAVEQRFDPDDTGRTRLFPTAGGILRSMDCSADGYTYISIDGAENCISALRDITSGGLKNCFVEMSACSGSCVGGPIMEKQRVNYLRSYTTVNGYARTADFDLSPMKELRLDERRNPIMLDKPQPSDDEIREILRKMGKMKPSDELNCGSCGYDTCREKAVAVFQGKADLTMCLPFLKDKAESFSDNVLRNTPNGIITLNEQLEIQQINRAALAMLNLRNASDVLGEQVVRILDPTPFMNVLSGSVREYNSANFLPEYSRYIEQRIVYDRSYRMLMCIMRDITEEETQRAEKEQLSRRTIEVTDKVIDKQMRAVQEIASLLGETTAETKIALTKLKESLDDEQAVH